MTAGTSTVVRTVEATMNVRLLQKTLSRKFLVLLLTLALVASACGSDDADSTSAEAQETGVDASADDDSESDEADTSSNVGAGDAADESEQVEAGGSADDAAFEEAEDAMEDEAMEEAAEQTAELSAGTESAERSSAPSAAPDSGFFDDPEPDTDDVVDEEADLDQDNTFRDYGVRPFVTTERDPLSTFALDVDTASYSIAKQWLTAGQMPPPESVRVEEFVNSFEYDYLAPSDGLNVQADGGPSPYDEENVIIRLGVQAERVANADRPDASLTFVVDTSGSMDRLNRLGLVKTALTRLTAELGEDDRVAIVTYSDNASVILPPTSVVERDVIFDAIDSLQPTGSTNLEAGLQRGYDLANESFQPGGINRVVLASDGVANVGLTDPDGLARLIRGDADRGIHLVTVGVGMGNFNDVVMEQLADQGDGFYAYVNDEQEADRLFSDDLVATLLTVAIDGKIQVEFNPETVAAYRLIGFENRAVLDDDFRNDAVDAGELGAGHQATALYEVTLRNGVSGRDQLGTAQLRWEDPEERTVRETRLVLTANVIDDRWADTADDFRLAVTTAAFAELLRNSPHTGGVSLDQVVEEAEALSPGSGPVDELAELVRLAAGRR
ncbi:MAG: von Willebrand factor type A domain-containing protein [Actinomycetota bacterium]